MNKDLQTEGIVLKRVNYGEADRILTLITPSGKISAMAKGVRKAKSKLAGGVEMFSLSLLNLREGKGELYTVTGAKMVKFYGGILKDFSRMELAGRILKEVAKRAEGVGVIVEGGKTQSARGEGAEFFKIARQSLDGLDRGVRVELVETWARLKLLNLTEGVNLYRDVSGERLVAEGRYEWNASEKAFSRREGGGFGAEEIKMLRIMVGADLGTVERVKVGEEVMAKVFEFTKMVV